jgi:hypothetical protein
MSPTEPWFAGRLRELSRDEGMASGWRCRCVEPWRPSRSTTCRRGAPPATVGRGSAIAQLWLTLRFVTGHPLLPG